MAAYIKVTYSVSSTTAPTLVARYSPWPGGSEIPDWIDHVTIGSSGGTVITIEPWAPEGTSEDYYAYTFPTTGNQDLYFFSKTTEIPQHAFAAVRGSYAPGYILSVDCSQSNNDITAIGNLTFANNVFMTGASLSDNITSLGMGAFQGDYDLTTINIPTGLTSLEDVLFYNDFSLTGGIVVPDKVESIDGGCFFNCSGITTVYLGSGITSLGSEAFKGCSSLTSITATSKNAQSLYTTSFRDVHTGGTLYYPAGYESEYGPESGWLSTEEYMLGYYGWNGVATGDTPSGASIYINPSAGTVSSQNQAYSFTAYTSGCVMDTTNFSYTISGDSFITDITIGNSPYENQYLVTCRFPRNTGATNKEAYINFVFQDTSGNTYPDTANLQQGTGVWLALNPNSIVCTSAATTSEATIEEANCNFDHLLLTGSTGGLASLVTTALSGNKITVSVPRNEAGQPYRDCNLSYLLYDTSGNTYSSSLYIVQEAGADLPPSGTSIYLDPTGVTAAGRDTSIWFRIYASGCVLDTTNFSYTTSGDSFITGISLAHVWDNQYAATVLLTPNTGLTDKDEYVDFVFYNTSGHQYTDTGRIIQLKNVYLALSPEYFNCTSAETRIEITIEEVNCTFDHMSVLNTYGSFDEASMAQITSSVTGNKLIIVIPKNGYGEPYRYLGYQIGLYDTDGNYNFATFYIDQQAGGGPENIAVNITDVNVGSGSSSTSGTISTTSCTYDHFTYMTGGSIPLTVTSGANNTLNVNAPVNNTSNSRVGYAYITFYDMDGNQYYQTVTIRQAAGTGPGPGPQPEPTWNILTSLTISDNEQHRFFIEAELGKSYKANGIEYKTVSACEARYSLYYINSYGGVDVMVFKGRSNKKTDNVTRFNYSRSFRNNTLEFENVNYMNEIKATWELQTGWLVDKQSKKMHELVESTCVYLYDAQEQVYIPVVMTDKTLEYKTYKNQNNRFYNYTIKVEESQSKERR